MFGLPKKSEDSGVGFFNSDRLLKLVTMKRIETILAILMLGFHATLRGGEELAWLDAYNVT